MENNWKPVVGDHYWFVGVLLEPIRATNDGYHADAEVIDVGNCFKTKEEAQAMADKFKAILEDRPAAESVDDLCLLPGWCKDAEYLYDYNESEYACIISANDSEVILVYDGDVEPITKSARYIIDCCEEAKCKPLSDDELKALVGKVLMHSSGCVSMVTDFRPATHAGGGAAKFYVDSDWFTAAELVNTDWRDSNYKCGNFTTER